MFNRAVIPVIFNCLFFLTFCNSVSAQDSKISSRTNWTTTNPFKADVFIENYGQFNNWITSSDSIVYAINNSEKIFFLQNGIIYRLDVVEKDDEQETAIVSEKQEKEHHGKIHSYYIKMWWTGCNSNVNIETSEESDGYYTFGEKGYENIKAKGYEKIIYKNLYPGIDAEYTIPAKGGIKYEIILHAGADLSLVKMKYSGDIENISSDSAGNIIIKTPAGNIIDRAPASFYEESNTPISSAFEINANTISFKLNELKTPDSRLQTPNSQLSTIIIDPWTTIPTSLTTDNAAYDIAFDDYGNVYVAGGTTTSPYFLAKYSSIGNLLWTFTNQLNWSSDCYAYSKFCILPHSGTTFMGEGFNTSGPRVMKISPGGALVTTSPNLPPNNEIWVMFYNRCLGQLIAFGGGTQSSDNIHIISDTNLTAGTSSNFNACTDLCNDITSAIMDYNGDFYALMASPLCSSNNHILKSLMSSNYSLPFAFDVNSGYDFSEAISTGIPGFNYGGGPGSTVRANTLTLNSNYLFSYDGNKLIAWNKTNGSQLGSFIVDPSYAGGQYRTHEGIAVDDCNNVYIGGTNKVHEFYFDGSTFIPITIFTSAIPNEVYDVSIDKTSSVLNVCGLGFISTFTVSSCTVNQLSISTSVSSDSCFGSATVIANNGTPPYSYLWSNGETTSTISGVPSGTYIVTVIDNSCILQHGIDTVVINSPNSMNISNDTTICFGSSVVLSVHGANTYSWSPATGLSSVTDSIITATPNDTITYIVTGTFPNGCIGSLPVTVNVTSPQNINVNNDTTICPGDSIMLQATGGSNYFWSPSETLSDATISNPIASPASTTTYTVTSAPCSETESVTISVISINTNVSNDTSVCMGEPAFLQATGGTDYFWIPPSGLNNQFSSAPIATPDSTTMYFVTISDGGCMKLDSVSITVFDCALIIPNVFTPNSDGINDYFNIIYEGFEDYHLIIFNRWGKVVFTSDNKNNLWNGKTPNDAMASDGVYYYILNVGDKSYHGFVTLLK